MLSYRNDCGVFAIKFMEKFCTRNAQSCSFTAKDIPDFRVKIAIDTLFNDYNSNVDQMDFISTFDLKVNICLNFSSFFGFVLL